MGITITVDADIIRRLHSIAKELAALADSLDGTSGWISPRRVQNPLIRKRYNAEPVSSFTEEKDLAL